MGGLPRVLPVVVLAACGRFGFHQADAAIDTAPPDAAIDASLDPSLVAWWLLGDGTGTVARDSSGHQTDGNLVNGPTWVGGRAGGALSFSGNAAQYVDVPADGAHPVFGILGAHAITVAAWVYATSSPSSSAAMYRGIAGANSYTNAWLLSGGDNPDSIGFYLSGTRTSTTTALPLAKWTHVAGVFDGTHVTIYFDGVEQVTALPSTTVDITSPGDIQIGGNPAGASWAGMLEDVRVYSRALDATEVAQLFATS